MLDFDKKYGFAAFYREIYLKITFHLNMFYPADFNVNFEGR